MPRAVRCQWTLTVAVAWALAACQPHTRVSKPVRGFRIVKAGSVFPAAIGASSVINRIDAGAGGGVFVQITSPERRYRISRDAGISFGPERSLAEIAGPEVQMVVPAFTGKGVSVSYLNGRNVFFRRSDDEEKNWSPPAQVNDEAGSVVSQANCVNSGAAITCVWADRRRGATGIYSSSSTDAGRAWTRNRPVDYDFREGNQMAPKLAPGARGRVIACWEDWRDRQTLADVRCSYSDDAGWRWSPSVKINDDSAYAWQNELDLVADGERIFAVFADFRDEGWETDHDWNIYFTSSADNGKTWGKNIRLNRFTKGRDTGPRLAMDSQGTLYAAWISNRRGIFGDVVISYSEDEGRTWPEGFRVSGEDRSQSRGLVELAVLGPGRLVCRWSESDYRSERLPIAELELASGAARQAEPIEQAEPVPALAVSRGRTLFQDDFSTEAVRWEPLEGVWMVANGAYLGVDPGAHFFSSFARFPEPESYVMEGRFMLDPVAHHRASLYFRANPARGHYYVVSNHFRFGAWLGIRLERPAAKRPFFLDSIPLKQEPYPFRSGVWYSFKLVVTGTQVDYYVDGRRMLSYSGKLSLPPGRAGLGGFANAPAYFDDLTISAIAPGKP